MDMSQSQKAVQTKLVLDDKKVFHLEKHSDYFKPVPLPSDSEHSASTDNQALVQSLNGVKPLTNYYSKLGKRNQPCTEKVEQSPRTEKKRQRKDRS